jgi:hypothetical protein
MRISRILLLPFALAACARGDASAGGAAEADSAVAAPPPPFAAGARDDCASPATDSARAVCIALRAARGERGIGSRVAEVVRQGHLYCVRTVPVDPQVIDGGVTVRVDREGRIRALMLTDSARSCGDLPPAEGISATDRRE